VRFPELGLQLAEPTPELMRRFKLEAPAEGLVVVGVEPEGPADRGGIERGMIITDVANEKVTTIAEFRAALAARPRGRDTVVRILKGDKAEYRVLLGEGPRPGPPRGR
jgi:serine protease Do